MKIREIISEQTKYTTLYHGTKPALAKEIQVHGLLVGRDTSWREFGPGIYLSSDVDTAKNYGSVIFSVKISNLNLYRLVPDDWELNDYFEMEGQENDPWRDSRHNSNLGGIFDCSWQDSLRLVQQCKYLDDIPPDLLTIVSRPIQEGFDYDLHQAYHLAWIKYQEDKTVENGQEFVRIRDLYNDMLGKYRAEEKAKDDVLAAQQAEQDETYHGQHSAPGRDSSAPLHDLTANGIYPDDFYDRNGMQHYSRDNPGLYYSVFGYKGRPKARVVIYRAVPKDLPRAEKKINPGDWVTLNRRYAVEHGRTSLKNNYSILSKTVFARHLFTDGDSLEEWGYDPSS